MGLGEDTVTRNEMGGRRMFSQMNISVANPNLFIL